MLWTPTVVLSRGRGVCFQVTSHACKISLDNWYDPENPVFPSADSRKAVPTKTRPYMYNIDPLKPHFYIRKLVFTEVNIIFLISTQKHRLWVLIRTASPRQFQWVPTIYILSRNIKISEFLSKNFHFMVVKFSVYLNRLVFVMYTGLPFTIQFNTLFGKSSQIQCVFQCT